MRISTVVLAAILGATLAQAEKMTIPTQAEQMGPPTPPWLIVKERESKPKKDYAKQPASPAYKPELAEPVSKPYRDQP
jgi:hypothetical protein